MHWIAFLRGGTVPGAAAGLIGGLVFGGAMARLGALPTIAALVGTDSSVAGFVVHMVIAALVGAGFGALVWQQRLGSGETLLWGLTYGTLWWFLGPLTLMPLLSGGAVLWDVRTAQAAFPSFLGHLLYGAAAGLALATIRKLGAVDPGGAGGENLFVGAASGLWAAWLVGSFLASQGQLPVFARAMTGTSLWGGWLVLAGVGVVAGLGFAWFFPRIDGSGPALIRGMVYGFFWWVIAALTVIPLLGGAGLTWSVNEARSNFATLPGFLILGAVLALINQWLGGVVRLLFAEPVREREVEGVGTESLRAVGRGAVAGLIGGLVFTIVMVRIGFLPTVARLVGSTSPFTGFIAHLFIADLIGVSYGLLFRRQTYDLGSALGWGVSYGFLWWIIGPLTLMPILLGASPQWTVPVAVGLTPSLVGHIAYGAALGVTFHLLEARYHPWWIPRSMAEAARAVRRREQLLTSAPGVWVLVAVIALTLPVVLGM